MDYRATLRQIDDALDLLDEPVFEDGRGYDFARERERTLRSLRESILSAREVTDPQQRAINNIANAIYAWL